MISADGSTPSRGAVTDPVAEVFVRAYGVRFCVRASEPSLMPRLIARLPPGTRTCRTHMQPSFGCTVESDGQWRVLLDGQSDSVANSESDALDAFESLVRFEVARLTPRWTFVHAGAVGWKDQIILIPGKSYSGKSTLVRALVEAGATYYSDEYAVLDRNGLVYPFAQPLMYRTASGARERLSVDTLGGTAGERALPVGWIVATRFVPDAEWNPVPVSKGNALLALLANTVRAQAAPARVMRTLAKVAEAAVTVESPRGDADDVVAALLSREGGSAFGDVGASLDA